MDHGIVVILLQCHIRTSHDLDEKTRTFTRAPMTPKEVRRRYSKGRVLEVVFKKGYKNKGICADVGGQPGHKKVTRRKSTVEEQLPSLRVRGNAL